MEASDIAVVVPTRGRPHSAEALCRQWEKVGSDARLAFAIDDDDVCVDDYRDALAIFDVDIHVGRRLRLAGTLNSVIRLKIDAGYAAVGFMGDDHRPRTEGWDRRFAECLSGGTGVVYGNDLLMGERMPTAVVMTSDIPGTLGYMCPPHFVHLCLDLVWMDWGEGIGRITYLDDVVIEHLHPANGKATMDAGYVEVNSPEMVSADSKTYVDYRDNGGLVADVAKLKVAMS
jgi:hypothetical protein